MVKRRWDKQLDEWVYEGNTESVDSGRTVIYHPYPAEFFAHAAIRDICDCESAGECECEYW